MFVLEVDDLKCAITPLSLEIFEHQAAVAMLSRRLATQQNSRRGEELWMHVIFDAPLRHQRDKALLIVVPAAPALAISVQQFLRRRQKRLVQILHVADGAQKIGEIVALREPGKLRRVIQPHV